ncbi:hypothetical protein OUZ56_005243 [Daphnia magna]|uniref:Uncharacterized protein n=1 Tax=Daphnia magna TaxID=35525 RepID=A0ABQ9YS89_9CRUS|nr:hypothetical protein OUZ56_005243 [Daphnia magna]
MSVLDTLQLIKRKRQGTIGQHVSGKPSVTPSLLLSLPCLVKPWALSHLFRLKLPQKTKIPGGLGGGGSFRRLGKEVREIWSRAMPIPPLAKLATRFAVVSSILKPPRPKLFNPAHRYPNRCRLDGKSTCIHEEFLSKLNNTSKATVGLRTETDEGLKIYESDRQRNCSHQARVLFAQ